LCTQPLTDPQSLMNSPKQSLWVSALILIAAIFLFDVQGAIIKHMGKRYPVEQIAFFRNVFGIFPYFIVLCFAREWRQRGRFLKMERWKLGLFRGFLLMFAQLSFYYAITNMQLATATTLAFSGPLFVTLLSIPLLGHKVGAWRTLAVFIGFAGVVMVMQPTEDVFSWVALLPIAAAFFYACTSLSSRFFDAEVPTALISIYASCGALMIAPIFGVVNGNWIMPETLTVWFWFIGMGAVGGMAVLLLITAYRMNDPSSLAPFEYFGIPFSFALGWIFFNEAPFDSLIPGVFFIVGGGLLVLWRERKLAKKTTSKA